MKDHATRITITKLPANFPYIKTTTMLLRYTQSKKAWIAGYSPRLFYFSIQGMPIIDICDKQRVYKSSQTLQVPTDDAKMHLAGKA